MLFLVPAFLTTVAAPAQAAPPKPGHLTSTTVNTSPALTWARVKQATSYRVQLSQSSKFDYLIDDITTTNLRYVPTRVLPLGKVHWRVQSVGVTGISGWAKQSFTRTQQIGPQLLGPATGVTLEQPEDPPVLRWQAVPGATSYHVEIDGVEHDWVDPQTYDVRTTAYVPTDVVPNGTYWWRVRAVFGTGVNSAYSEARNYTIGALRSVVKHPVDDGVAPDDATTEVVLSWDPVPGAVRYDVRVSTDNGFNTIIDQRQVVGTRYSPPTTYDNTSYYWQVRAVNVYNQAAEWPTDPEETGVFRRSWPDVATLQQPADQAAVTGPVSYQWTPVTWASRYQLQVSKDPGFSLDVRTCETPHTTYTASSGFLQNGGCQPDSAGTWYWRVRGLDDPRVARTVFTGNGQFTWTAAPTPGTPAPQPATGQRVALNSTGATPCTASLSTEELCTVNQTPLLRWDPVPTAAYYRIYLSRDRSFTNMVYGDAGDVYGLPLVYGSEWITPQELPDTQAGQAYYWFVRACYSDGTCGPSPTEATNAFRKKSAPVNLQAPADGATTGSQVTFSWEDYLTTNQAPAQVNEDTGENSTQAARLYRIQVSKTDSFAQLVDEAYVDQTTYTAFDKLYPEGRLYWRVQVQDGGSNYVTWSPTWSFTKKSPVPAALSPSEGESVNGIQPFRWETLEGAAYYDLEVYRNADTQASPANLALYAYNVRQTAYTYTEPVQVLSTDYVWRLRRTDLSGNKSDWGPWHRFRVTGELPKLTSPRSGAKVSGGRAWFRWSSTRDASSYIFEARTKNGVTVSQATAATSYAPTTALTKGTWNWRVKSVDARGLVVRTTSWRKVKVR